MGGAVHASNVGDGPYTPELTHRPFMFDWLFSDLIGMPLSLIALLSVMELPLVETAKKSASLSVATVAMVLFAFFGDTNTGSLCIGIACFGYILYELVLGLADGASKQTPDAQGLVTFTRWFIVATWGAYPFVAVLPM